MYIHISIYNVHLLAALFPSHILPCRMVLAFVTEKAFFGDLALSPYNFRYQFDSTADPCRIEHITLSLNGVEISGLPTGQKALHYLKMFMSTEMKANGVTNDITYDKFGGGYFFSFFDMTTSLTASSVLMNPVTRSGQVRYII